MYEVGARAHGCVRVCAESVGWCPGSGAQDRGGEAETAWGADGREAGMCGLQFYVRAGAGVSGGLVDFAGRQASTLATTGAHVRPHGWVGGGW